MDHNLVLEQSKNAYGQWCVQWREHAKIHSKIKMHDMRDFENIGIGRACVIVANGRSLQDNIETLKANRHNVDIMCCDKSLGHLIDNGITPNYLMVADANVNYEKYLEPWIDKCKNIIMFQNVCGNPKWSQEDKFKKIYFYVNRDILKSELEFSKISGCNNFIVAATNVSGAEVVFLTQCDNDGRRNFFGYDMYLLLGFDYSWEQDKYYSFDDQAGGKEKYMRHQLAYLRSGDPAFTSHNLVFSSKWLEEYVNLFQLPVILCTKKSILNTRYTGELDKYIKYKFKEQHKHEVKALTNKREQVKQELLITENRIKQLAESHHKAFITTLWG